MVYRFNNPLGEMFREFESLRREVDRIFEDAGLGRLTRPFSRFSFLPGWQARAYPLINMSEEADAFHVEAMAPGVDPESLNVSVQQNQLTISGEKPAPKDVNAEQYHRNERAAGKFVRTIQLPTEVNAAEVTAEYKDGLLQVRLPKSEAAKPKQITVKSA